MLHLFSEVIAEGSIAVAQQAARELVKGTSLPELLSRPLRGWVVGHIEAECDGGHSRVVVITEPLTRTKPSGPGMILSSGGSLNDPLGLMVAPNGHILVVNRNDGFITEITARGAQIAGKLIDKSGNLPGAGALFGVTFDQENGVVFVDDATNTLNLLE